MSIIVDGYNYIGRCRELELSDPTAADKLIYLLGQYGRKTHSALTVVFDGNYCVDQANRKRQYGRVTVVYTSPIYTADEQIKKMVRTQTSKHRRTLLVVSSDADILHYTHSHGAAAIKSEEFERRLQLTLAADSDVDRINIRLSEQEVQKWLDIFEAAPSKRHTSAQSAEPSSGRAHKTRGVNGRVKQEEHARPARSASEKKHKAPSSGMSDSEPLVEKLDRINVHLSPEEVEQWLKIFEADQESPPER